MSRSDTTLKVVTAVINTTLVLLYPALVYLALTHWSLRGGGLLLVGVVIGAFVMRARGRRRAELWAVARLPLAVVGLIVLGVVLNDPVYVLLMPVLINAALLVGFGVTLRQPVSMVERFARLQHPDLPDAHLPYCRKVTLVWCVFFVVNGTIAAGLALWAPVSWWALYTGIIAYALMGCMFTGEYIVRKVRFREFGTGLHDRALRRIIGEGHG